MRLMDKKQKSDKIWPSLGLVWELGYLIAVPLVILALLGRMFDKKLGTSPWLLIAGLLFSVSIFSYLVYKKAISLIDRK